MTDTRVVRRLLRWTAVAVAVAAVIDPAWISSRHGRLLVSVVAADPRDPEVAALVARVASALGVSTTVIAAPLPAADATVIVGDRLPDAALLSAAPIVAVVQGGDAPRIAIESMELPRSATLDATVSVVASMRWLAAAGRNVEVTLSVGGVVVDRISRRAKSADERVDVVLSAVAGDTGVLSLRVEARVAGGTGAGVSADGAVQVGGARYAILFYDARPSFASTFVRRAVERDARFAVTARTITSRTASVDAGAPPARIDDAASLAAYDVVVVGAPGELGATAVAALDVYLRNRGGSVLLLLDERNSAPVERLTGTGDWRAASGQVGVVKRVGGAAVLRTTSVVWPAVLPWGASVIAVGDSGRPVVWKSPVGAGQVVVSGALDAWRFRDPASSAFERFWLDQIADAAANAPAPIAISAPSVAAPTARLTVAVDLRDAALRVRPGGGAQSLRVSVSAKLARLDGPDAVAGVPTDLRLWPTGSVGHFEASVYAPLQPGNYSIDVESGSARASAPLVVRADASAATPSANAMLEAWVTGHGGSVIPVNNLGRLAAAVRVAAKATPRAEPWYPMRSAWWLVLFAVALSAEWWLRRRTGLA